MPITRLNVKPDLYLKELGTSLNVLYVEDDENVQAPLNSILKRFFNKVDLACNGQEGLEKMRANHYDLVISDINMPIMNGIEMIQHALKEKLIDKILITSAHNDADKFLALINLGVDGFILKPIDLQQLLTQLVHVCEPIHEHKMLEHYIKELESSNQELMLLNQQLDLMVSKMETHPDKVEIKEALSQLQSSSVASEVEPAITHEAYSTVIEHSNALSAEDFHRNYPIELGKKNEDLENIEDDYEMLLSKASSFESSILLQKYTSIIERYAETLESIPNFQSLAAGIEDLSKTFSSIDDATIIERLMPMISSLLDTLHRWRIAVFVRRDAENIHYLDDSIISDAQALKGMLGFSDSSSENDSDIDLF